jgi:hypothetical protein
MYHAIHAFGLAELLKSGTIANVDDEHFWNLIDNTYIDDVSRCTHIEQQKLMPIGERSNGRWTQISIR